MDDSTPPTGALADLSLQDDTQNLEAVSPNAMAVDAPEEHVVEPNGAESENVAVINPDAMDTDTLLASDCTLARGLHRHPVTRADLPQTRP